MPVTTTPSGHVQPSPRSRSPQGYTALRVTSLAAGSLLGLVALAALAAGGWATWADNTQRDAAGYLTSSSHPLATPSYAITSHRIDLVSSDVLDASSILGKVRIQATAIDPTKAVFIGIAPRASADRYLAGVGRAVVTSWTVGSIGSQEQAGGAPAKVPTEAAIWDASVSGTGTQTLTWKPHSGNWMAVVMTRDASPGVAVTANAGATIPDLGWVATGLFAGGGLLMVAATLLVAVPIVKASRSPASSRSIPGAII